MARGATAIAEGAPVPVDRFLASGYEAGTAPEDRPFRPDVEGLRAVAVVLVVLFHARLSALAGGYVGVDVFFVISGFVITGVLLRERSTRGRTSILAFYGRRCRRILPAATVVIVASVAISYFVLGVISGNQTADDARWAAVFLANFHFAWLGTNYFTAQQPPSPLQHFWSLAVEEQFYVVYPTLFVVLASIKRFLSLRARLALGLGSIIVGSFVWSVVQTNANPTAAYFSPLTRAWELALGALVAVAAPWLLRVPASVATVMTWVGLAGILIAAFTFGAHSIYPGSVVALPVVAAAIVIAGGTRARGLGAEALLGTAPFRAVGRLSYSLYLWHWPILIMAAEWNGKTSLPLRKNVVWVLIAVALSAGSYFVVENPIRHARFVLRRRWRSVGLGAALIGLTLAVVTAEMSIHSGGGTTTSTASSVSPVDYPSLRGLVSAASHIRTLPADLSPPLASASTDWGIPPSSTGCWPAPQQSRVRSCVFGDPHGVHTIVLYGDSHAAMWFQAFDDIATASNWKLVVLNKGACPVDALPYVLYGKRWFACDRWQRNSVSRINQLHPDLVVVTQMYPIDLDGSYSPPEWQHGLEGALRSMKASKTTEIVLGEMPITNGGPLCLSQHVQSVQACSEPPPSWLMPYEDAERSAAQSVGARYVDVNPWFCSTVCPSVIGHFDVYGDAWHITRTYSRFLERVLEGALQTPGAQRTLGLTR